MVSAHIELVGILLAVIGGVALAVQAGVNSSLGRNVGKGLAGVFSFASGLVFLTVYFVISTYAAKAQGPSKLGFKEAPWYAYIGGFLGAFYVIVVIIFAQQLGNATLTGVAVTAQLITAVVLDSFGWVGFVKRDVPWPRTLGAVLMVIGVVLVSVFHGAPKHSN